MDGILLIARLLLSAVFLVAGVAKLFDLAGSRKAVAGFGVPEALAGPFGTLLPLVEIAIGLALLSTRSAWYASLTGAALFALFVAGIGVNMSLGRAPDCHCFGQLHSEPVGWSTLVRNIVLTAIAAFIAWQGRPAGWNGGMSLTTWWNMLSNPDRVGLGVAIVGFALLFAQWQILLNLLQQNGRMLTRLEAAEANLSAATAVANGERPAPAASPPAAPRPVLGLPVGTQAPAFSLRGLYGETMTLDALRARGKPILLVFTDPGCGPCNALLPEASRWQMEHADEISVAVISRGTVEANSAKAAEHGLTQILLQNEYEVANAYKSAGTPSGVIVRPDGTIGSPITPGPDAIRALVSSELSATAALRPAPSPLPPAVQAQTPSVRNGGNGSAMPPVPSAPPVGSRVGQPAPAFSMTDVDDRPVSLEQYRGLKAVMLFWNTGCGFCRQMLPDLKAWEQNRPAGSPDLLIVSAGKKDDIRQMGVQSNVVYDPNFSIGNAYGAQGTPMAVLIDERGNIASEVAAGAPAVLALAGGTPDGAQPVTL